MIITNSDIIKNSGVSNVNISDHQMILLTRKKAKFTKQKRTFIGYRNYNKNLFQEQVEAADWNQFDASQNPIEKWDLMKNIIEEVINVMCPIKTFRINQIKQPWITPPLIELINDKDLALKRANKSKNKEIGHKPKGSEILVLID